MGEHAERFIEDHGQDPMSGEDPMVERMIPVGPVAEPMELCTGDVVGQVRLIQEVMREVMVEGTHYGTIPGCKEPSLYKAGAEKLGLTFRFAPTYKVERRKLHDGHVEYSVICALTHIPTGRLVGEGLGSCSTMESKYRWRKGERVCPKCEVAAVIKGQEQYGGGWLCWKKKEGCGAKWGDDSEQGRAFERTEAKVENPDIADQYNTVLKMAKKRAFVDATISATAASDVFAQDIEDLGHEPAAPAPQEPEPAAPSAENPIDDSGTVPEKRFIAKPYFERIKKATTKDAIGEILREAKREGTKGEGWDNLRQAGIDRGAALDGVDFDPRAALLERLDAAVKARAIDEADTGLLWAEFESQHGKPEGLSDERLQKAVEQAEKEAKEWGKPSSKAVS